MNTFLKAQFSYCPPGWMCHSRPVNNIINRLHERCLRIIYNDQTSSLVDLFAKDGSIIIHARNLQVLVTEILKIHKKMSTELMQGRFCVRQTHYNLRNPHHFAIPSVNSFHHGSKSISNLGPRIWNLVPDRLKEPSSISSFKNGIKDGSLNSARVGYVRPISLALVFCNSLQVT